MFLVEQLDLLQLQSRLQRPDPISGRDETGSAAVGCSLDLRRLDGELMLLLLLPTPGGKSHGMIYFLIHLLIHLLILLLSLHRPTN